MPQVSVEDLAALRDQHQYSRFYLGVLVPETVHSSQINYATIPRGEMSIPFDGGVYATGFAFANVVAGMTLWVGSTENSHDICKLRLRVPYNRTCTPGAAYSTGDGGVSGTIEVCEHNFLLQDNYYLTIKEEFKLWPKHATADQGGLTVTRYNDYDIQYCGQNRGASRDPIVRMGPPGVAIRDATTGDAVVNFWSDSGAAPGGGAPGAYAWAWRGGNPASAATAGTAAIPHEVTWANEGNYLAALTLDGTVSGYRPVFIFAPTGSGAPYEDFEVQNLGGDFDTGGWRMSVRVKEDCAEADFPEESMIVLFAKDWYKGDEVSIGGNYRHRENIIFLGHITRESVRRDPYTNDVLFEAHTIDGEMKNIEQFPLSVEDDPNANADWGQIQDMTVDKVAYFLMKWQSTLLDINDVYFSGDTKQVRWFDIAQKSFYEQLDQDCYDSAILGRCMSDRMGIVRCELNPQFLDVGADRNAIDTIMDIETQDWRNEIELPSPQSDRCSLVDLSAGSYAGGLADVQLIFSLAHGDVPMERGRSITVDNLIGQNQNQCNRVAGNYLANQNNPYPSMPVPIQLNYRVFDITPQEWVTMSLAAEDTYRGVEWTEERLLPRVINFNLENAIGALNVDLRLEAESSGTAGVPGYYPTEPPEDDYVPPSTPEPPPWTPPGEEWEGKVWVATDKGVARNNDITTSNVWTAVNTGLTGNALNVYGLRIVTQDEEAVIVSQDGVYKATNIKTTCAWSCILSLAAMRTLVGNGAAVFSLPIFYGASGDTTVAKHPVMSWYLDPGYVGCFAVTNKVVWYIHTHNYGGDGWTAVNLNTALGLANIGGIRAAVYSTAISGRLHVMLYPQATGVNARYAYSTDYGHAWTLGLQTDTGYQGTFINPHNNLSQTRNINDNFVLSTRWTLAGGVTEHVQESTTGWNTAAWTDIGDVDMDGAQEIRANPFNPNYIIIAEDTPGGASESVWTTKNGGVTWTEAWACTDGDPVKRIARNPYNEEQWIFGFGNPLDGSGWVYYTDDFLVTSPPTNRTGNIATVLNGMSRVTDIKAM